MPAPHLLLVDDEPHILRAAEFKLKRQGYDVVCAGDGQEAWEQIQRRVPDLLVTDYQMPRLDGLQLIARVREHPATKSLPVILLTAKSFELTQHETREQHGVLDVVAKPFSPRNLCQRIEAALSAETSELAASARAAES